MGSNDNKFRVLFVCAGNTCRSPMAAAVLSHLLVSSGSGSVLVDSAGASASDGALMTPEAGDALLLAGIAVPAHRSRRLTRAMVSAADLVLTMEPSQRQAVLALDPAAPDRVHVLHAFGEEEPDAAEVVHDPYGGSPEVYAESLRRIRHHVERVHRYLEQHLERAAGGHS